MGTLTELAERANQTVLWKSASGTGGRYIVSSDGEVRRSDGFLLKPSKPRNSREYPAVMLRHSGQRKRVAIHRLVALNFLGLPPCAGAEVRHLNGNPLDSRASNLAWGTQKDNADDRKAHGRTAEGERHGLAKLSDYQRHLIRSCTLPTRDLAALYGVHRTTIQKVRAKEIADNKPRCRQGRQEGHLTPLVADLSPAGDE